MVQMKIGKVLFPLIFILCICTSINLFCNNISYQYNSSNRISSVIYGNGYSITYNYDSHGNLSNQTITTSAASPNSPTQFTLTLSGNNRTLSWHAVTTDVNGTPITVTSYSIEASDNPYTGFVDIGSTSQCQYTDTSTSHDRRFYRIRAVLGSKGIIKETKPEAVNELSRPKNKK
jgi:YD repeat-containing protein